MKIEDKIVCVSRFNEIYDKLIDRGESVGKIYYTEEHFLYRPAAPSFGGQSGISEKLLTDGLVPVYSNACYSMEEESKYFMGWYPVECFISYKIVNRDNLIDEILL